MRILLEYIFFSACFRLERWSYPGGYSRGGGFLFMSIACYVRWGLYLLGIDVKTFPWVIIIPSSFFMGFVFAEVLEKWYLKLKKKYMYDEMTTDYGVLVLLFIIIPYVACFVIDWKSF